MVSHSRLLANFVLSAEETTEHLFLNFSFARKILDYIYEVFGVKIVLTSNITNLLESVLKQKFSSQIFLMGCFNFYIDLTNMES